MAGDWEVEKGRARDETLGFVAGCLELTANGRCRLRVAAEDEVRWENTATVRRTAVVAAAAEGDAIKQVVNLGPTRTNMSRWIQTILTRASTRSQQLELELKLFALADMCPGFATSFVPFAKSSLHSRSGHLRLL
jgi:hypothetical protein